MYRTNIFLAFLMMVGPAFGDTRTQIDMTKVIVQSDASCSGVIVSDQLIVTAKHCGRTTFFRNAGRRCRAQVVWVSDMPDGPVFYRVPRGFGYSVIGILPSPPKPKTSVDLFWSGQTVGVNGRVAGLQTVEVQDHLQNTKYKIESNLVMARSVPGSSGGAAVQDNQLAGIILHGNGDMGETGICVNEDLRRGYMLAMKELQKLDTVEVYTISRCVGCNQMHNDYDAGKYVKMPAEFHFVNCDNAAPPGVTVFPTYEIYGNRFTQPNGYDGQAIANWVCQQVKEKELGSRNDALLEPVPEFKLPDVNVPNPPESKTFPPSDSEVSEDDWKGVRIIGVASDKYSRVSALLAGPIARMVGTMSNGKAKFETVFQASEPVKYRGIATAAGISDLDMPIYVFVLVDTIAEVNFVKGLILKKIESNIDKALTDKLREIPVEPVIRRIHPELYSSILRVVEMQEPEAPAPDPVASVVADKDRPAETSNASHAIAGGFSFLSISTLFRIWRFWQGWHHSTTVEQTLDLSQVASPVSVTVRPPVQPVPPPPQPPATV